MTTNSTRRDADRGLVIEIEQEFSAARDRVFRRWTEADALARWFAPPGYATLHAESDPRPGGRWRLDFRAESGDHQYTEHGAFREVDPFERLALTLTQLDGAGAHPETLVTVALDDIGTEQAPRTRMRFTQSGYRSLSLRNDNEQGWQGCFAALAADLASGERS
ncbi:SRPBCC domain-containing protein [Streptomyces sp. DSM 44917]|uniref:SRPBCC domain-containing protein n=1 Tax=Streptomyces boetiae TaxID=3075541 RepID=A0ABU2LAX1_9ACTN|nr:SRPBCC domain-containing protein [Streptomyces sp. DSM 44917]MDT0308720.1 SRPBCC domain-containing protein [Streptomyces sp. DSM 44917]